MQQGVQDSTHNQSSTQFWAERRSAPDRSSSHTSQPLSGALSGITARQVVKNNGLGSRPVSALVTHTEERGTVFMGARPASAAQETAPVGTRPMTAVEDSSQGRERSHRSQVASRPASLSAIQDTIDDDLIHVMSVLDDSELRASRGMTGVVSAAMTHTAAARSKSGARGNGRGAVLRPASGSPVPAGQYSKRPSESSATTRGVGGGTRASPEAQYRIGAQPMR